MRQFVSTTSILANEGVIYYLMNTDEAVKQMSKTIAETNEILGLPSITMVRLLLDYFHWDKSTLTDRYWEDPDRLLRILNIANPNLSSNSNCNPFLLPINFEQDLSASSKLIICNICCSQKPLKEFYSLSCHHQHCLTCWQLYLESAITHGASGQKISCPSRCNQIVDDEQIYQLLSGNERLKKRYQQIVIDTFVEKNRLTQWCPGNACLTIVKLKSFVVDCAQMITCDMCKITFCFQCLKQWHDPVQCALLKRWEKKNRDESMTCEWIIANTKDCPTCHSSIEKNGGCNHMTCQKPGCGHEFCWLCLGSWKDHATRQCNVYEEDKLNRNRLTARENLARYMHYFTRYETHNQSLELESKLSAQIEQRIQKMQAESMSFTEQQAIYKAFDVLQQCRRTLKYTYVFAFYLYRNNQAQVFEQNQADLEREIEGLSGYLEKEIDTEQNIPLKLMDKTRYCDQRRKILLDHCKEGYAEHYWAGLDLY